MSERNRQRLRTTVTILVTALVIAPATALAGHQFTDVPDSNIFHDDIDWMRDNGVTAGCNPPANDKYCPDDNVTREQMAAFMHRLDTENVFLRPGEGSLEGGDADTLDGKDSTEFLGATDKASDSDKLDGKDATEFGGRLFAVVASDGTLVRGNRADSAASVVGTGHYEVIFDRDVTDCAYIATIGDTGDGGELGGGITVASRLGNANGAFVDTSDPDGIGAERSFHLFVIC